MNTADFYGLLHSGIKWVSETIIKSIMKSVNIQIIKMQNKINKTSASKRETEENYSSLNTLIAIPFLTRLQ